MAEFRITPTAGKRELNSYCIRGTNQVVKAGDCVLMRPSATGKAPPIARIEGIEADDGGNVKVRLRLYYRPQEALGGRRKFHGSKELLLSDHYDVQSAHSIGGKCIVHSFKNYTKLENVGAEDYYCRFEYNAATGAFTPDHVAVYCKCEMPYNPDEFMVKCKACKDRFHPACIDMTFEEAKKLDHHVCSECASKHDDKRQKQHNGFPSSPGEADAELSEPPSYKDLEEIAKKERERIENLLNSKGVKYGSYPHFTVAVRGQKVTVKFQISPACDFPQLVSNLVSNLGLKVDERNGGSDMHLRAWNSAVAWQLTLQRPEKSKSSIQDKGHSVVTDAPGGDLCVLLFRSLISTDKAEIEFMKNGSFSTIEIDALVTSLQLAGGRSVTLERQPNEGGSRGSSLEKSVSALESMGVKIYGLTGPLVNSSKTEISWDDIAGCDQQKREIEDTILLALHSPEVYDDIARGTRRKFDSNRPRAVLFEGPPGTGKTSCAQVIASQACVPLLYVPLEIVVSKYYQEIERLLGEVFSLANELPNGAIIFLDEVDAIAIARDTVMHEATRRNLSILLRQIDGFEQMKKAIVVAATNRKQDLDPALISRFDATISFCLPDQLNCQKIVAQYAKHLSEFELEQLAKVTKGLSGRDIRDVCQQAERSWASKIIRGQMDQREQMRLPPFSEYIHSALNRV